MQKVAMARERERYMRFVLQMQCCHLVQFVKYDYDTFDANVKNKNPKKWDKITVDRFVSVLSPLPHGSLYIQIQLNRKIHENMNIKHFDRLCKSSRYELAQAVTDFHQFVECDFSSLDI